MTGMLLLDALALNDLERCLRRYAWAHRQEAARRSDPLLDRFRELLLRASLMSPEEADPPIEDPKLRELWRRFGASPEARRRGAVLDHGTLTIAIEGWSFLARVDRVFRVTEGWEIVIWLLHAPPRARLERLWEMRLARLGLSLAGLPETGPLPPERLSVTVWDLANSRFESIPYTARMREQDRRDFLALAAQSSRPLDPAEAELSYPRTGAPEECPQCPFQARCFGPKPGGESA